MGKLSVDKLKEKVVDKTKVAADKAIDKAITNATGKIVDRVTGAVEDQINKAAGILGDITKKITGEIITPTTGSESSVIDLKGGKIDSRDILIDESIDQFLERLPVGSVSKAIGNNLHGINYRQTRNAVPRSKDQYGFTFFTRPQLNLRTGNIGNYTPFYSLLTDNALSYQRYVRMMLDPRLADAGSSGSIFKTYGESLKSPLVDNQSAFIPILSNDIESLSGWPDLQVPTYTSASGLYGEEMSFTDGMSNNYETFDIDVTFRNSKGNPLIYLFWVWVRYQSLVFEGILNPYSDMVAENEVDYNTRIYRLVLSQDKRYVTYIGCTGASFPTNVPLGNLFDYNTDTPYNTNNRDINIRFRSMGFLAFSDVIKKKFNEAVAIFNPTMGKLLRFDLSQEARSKLKNHVFREDPTEVYRIPGTNYIRIPHAFIMTYDASFMNVSVAMANHKAYPYINLHTNELEWWAEDVYMSEDRFDLSQAEIDNSKPEATGEIDPEA